MTGPTEDEIRKAAEVIIREGLAIIGPIWEGDNQEQWLETPEAVMKYLAMRDAHQDFLEVQKGNEEKHEKAAR